MRQRLLSSMLHRYIFYHIIFILLLCVVLGLKYSPEKCETCKAISTKFREGVSKTAKSNYGGGNTQWEEKNLGTYEFSETRLIEITEGLCDSEGKECHKMVEENEELIEHWWFKMYAKGQNVNIHDFLCINKLKVCCPTGTYGEKCIECTGGKQRPCKGNGNCDGDGTRSGTGKCNCWHGYRGELCDQCTDGFYELSRNETHTICKACHKSCKSLCSEAGPTGCDECKDGYDMHDTKGCLDINECDVSPCDDSQFCVNTDGSYQCTACDTSCNGCTGPGSNSCLMCAKGYFKDASTCRLCHESCLNTCSDQSEKTCDSCKHGWQWSDYDTGCQDVNECLLQQHTCQPDEYCINTVGSYKCSTCHSACRGCTGAGNNNCIDCKAGYNKSDSGDCIDIDECRSMILCNKPHMSCTNTIGSYKCVCEDGYVVQAEECVPKPKEKPAPSKKTGTKPKNADKSRASDPLDNAIPTKNASKSKQTTGLTINDVIVYVSSLVGFVLAGVILQRSLLAQSCLTALFWLYLLWLAVQLDRKLKIKS